MGKTSSIIRIIVDIALFAAIGFALDTLQGGITKGLFPNGGSIGFAMIAVIIIGMRKGFLPALFTGLIIGLFDFLTGPYIVSPVQAILDYITPYAFVSVSALFRPIYYSNESKGHRILVLILATIAGGLAKFLSHFFAGFFFLKDTSSFAWGLEAINPYFYCFIYNIAFIGPSIVLSAGIMAAIEGKASFIITSRIASRAEGDAKTKIGTVINYVIPISLMAIGLGLFIYYIIMYANSIEVYDDGYGGTGFEVNEDAFALAVFSLATLGTGIFGLIYAINKIKKEHHVFGVLSVVCLSSALYATGITLKGFFKALSKGREYPFDSYRTYIIWIAVSATLALIALILMLFLRRKNLKEVQEKEITSTN